MIGIFDSGVGGLCACKEVRRLLPREDILFLADRKNAPYGTKSKDEILKFTKNNIKLLRKLGADKILIACCTASSLYNLLSHSEREIATPIITPAARLAAELGGRVAVIATNHTVKSHAFSREIVKISPTPIAEMAEQQLVALVERGNRDGRLDSECREYLRRLAVRIRASEAEVLILGCTHFSHLEYEIGRLLPDVKIISPAREGAKEIVKKINPNRKENGKDVYM